MLGPSVLQSPIRVESSDGEETSNFNFRGRNVFLTYPRCDLDPLVIRDALWDKLETHKPLYIVAARETHQDGGYHVHSLVQLTAQFRTRDPSYFDLGEHHPNIQTVRSPARVRDYVLKDPITQAARGTFVGPNFKPARMPSRFRNPNDIKDEKMREILRTATNRSDYLTMVRKTFPFEWATRLASFEYSANKLFPDIPVQYVSPFSTEDLMCHENINDWLQTDLYTVSSTAYSLVHPQADAVSDLQWMADVSRNPQEDGGASTSAVPVERARLAGLGL